MLFSFFPFSSLMSSLPNLSSTDPFSLFPFSFLTQLRSIFSSLAKSLGLLESNMKNPSRD